jgi:vitamin B12/bleomycin/antimicrobial peptide transport system ATP-binding/permease protein
MTLVATLSAKFIELKAQTRKVWALSLPYFQSDQKWKARALLIVVMALNLFYVYVSVQFNEWYRVFYDALQNKQVDVFWAQIRWFCVLAVLNIVVQVYKLYLTQRLELNWREWMTRYYLTRWTSNKAFYQMELARYTPQGEASPDNPDQRIQEDIKLFTDYTVTLSMGFLLATVNIAAFIGILWGLSRGFEFTVGGQTYYVIGFLVWLALLYAAAGSVFTHLVGRPLVALNFEQQKTEAHFRHDLVRVREYSESIALYKGEAVERQSLNGRFTDVLQVTLKMIWAQKRLTWFTASYGQAAVIFPFIVVAPRYFAGVIQLGEVMQTASAFGEVQGSLSWIVDNYSRLALWKATTDRLTGFESSLRSAETLNLQSNRPVAQVFTTQQAMISVAHGDELQLDHLGLSLPNGHHLAQNVSLQARMGDTIVVQGPSGSGKSTLLRSIAGIWPFATGKITRPEGFDAQAMFIPQRPYFPNATLRIALAYPDDAAIYTDAALCQALDDALLPQLKTRLNEEDAWGQKLSGGEQQRLALARVFLKKPRWVFADEATSALDPAAEQTLYERLRAQVRKVGGALVSIAHRPAVANFHTQQWTFEPLPAAASVQAGTAPSFKVVSSAAA